MIADIFHDMLGWEYDAKLWVLDHPAVLLGWLVVALLVLLWGINR